MATPPPLTLLVTNSRFPHYIHILPLQNFIISNLFKFQFVFNFSLVIIVTYDWASTYLIFKFSFIFLQAVTSLLNNSAMLKKITRHEDQHTKKEIK